MEGTVGEGTMEMELISRETIKPSLPTPPHLRIHALSFLDHIVNRSYVPLVYFYPSKVCDQGSKILKLKKSLSEVLCRYYPLAGRLRDQFSIECNDQGVSLLVTQIRCKLSVILQNPSVASLNPLFADELQYKDIMSSSTASIVAIQINCFSCGGMAISVCMCHKVGDAPSLLNFVNDWATLNRKYHDEGELAFPLLDAGASVFPRGDLPAFPDAVFVKANTVSRWFVFEASKIESLRDMVSSHKVENPTPKEVLIALIYKSVVSALRLTAQNTALRITVNLRKRMFPPLPDKSIGNMVWSFFVSSQIMDKREGELHDLVSKMREGLSEFCSKCVKSIGGKYLPFISEYLKLREAISVPLDRKNRTSVFFISWCGFPIYKADFGWGKPIWVTTCGCPVNNSILLMDTIDGNGIEALVNMAEQDMSRFQCDAEFLKYASLKIITTC